VQIRVKLVSHSSKLQNQEKEKTQSNYRTFCEIKKE
jgi:hypothetical protein